MTGTLLNMATVLVGSLLGLFVGQRLPQKIQESVLTGLGLVTLVIGVDNAQRSGNIILPLLSLVIGVIVGELIDVDGGLNRFGGWLQSRAARATSGAADSAASSRARFINGFVTASLVFCVGPMTIMGSIQNGINVNDIQLLAVKSTLDFFASMAFAASLGIGVAFSLITIFVVQGSFTLVGVALVGVLAGSASGTLTASNPYIRELTATGGLVLCAVALVLLDLKKPRAANFLPALLVAPLLVLLAGLVGINIYPF